MRAWRRVTLAAALFGCAGPAGPPEVPWPVPDAPPPAMEAAIEARIQESLPRVSYQRPPPDAFGMDPGPASPHHLEGTDGRLEPEQVRRLIRSLESLDGEGRIVCVPARGRVFGDCSFPLSPEADRTGGG